MVFDNNLFQPHLYTDFSQPPPPPPPDDTLTNKCGNEESFGEYTPNTRPGSSFDIQGQQPTRGGFRPQMNSSGPSVQNRPRRKFGLIG
jgi:hypothetical protein